MVKIADEKPKVHSRLRIRNCGLTAYRETLILQQELVRRRRGGEIPDTVLIVEHRSVITLGARESKNKLLVAPEFLAQREIDLVPIRRGGGATAHNPGQLVFYPILDLTSLGLGVSEFIRELEVVGIELLSWLEIKSTRRKGFPGLWVGERKIASIGVRLSRGITYHGMAINITNDLTIFDFIAPCGLDDVEMTSVLRETHTAHSMEKAKRLLTQILVEHWATEDLVEYESCR